MNTMEVNSSKEESILEWAIKLFSHWPLISSPQSTIYLKLYYDLVLLKTLSYFYWLSESEKTVINALFNCGSQASATFKYQEYY